MWTVRRVPAGTSDDGWQVVGKRRTKSNSGSGGVVWMHLEVRVRDSGGRKRDSGGCVAVTWFRGLRTCHDENHHVTKTIRTLPNGFSW